MIAGDYYMNINREGYEYFTTWFDGKEYRLNHHRLLASLDVEPEDMEDRHIHHKNGVEWCNYRDNLQVVTPEQHRQIHAAD
jgi:hypothetical protein